MVTVTLETDMMVEILFRRVVENMGGMVVGFTDRGGETEYQVTRLTEEQAARAAAAATADF